jgi:hypothetical protein
MTTQAAQIRIHGKIPHVEAITRSYAMLVRDAMIARLKTMQFFQGFKFSRSHALQINSLPYCAVYFMGEQMTQDGNANIGEVRFSSEARYGISILMLNNDPDVMEDRLDNAFEAAFQRLLRDPTFMNNKDYQIEAFTKASRQHIYGSMNAPQTNEMPYAELRAELFCDLGAIEYEPRVEYMLETIHVETVHPPGAEEGEVQRVFSFYDMNTVEEDDNG